MLVCLSCDGCLSFNCRPLVNLWWPWEFILNLLLASQVKSLTTFTQFWCRSVGFHYLSKRVGHGHVNVKPKNPITDTHWYTLQSEPFTLYWLKMRRPRQMLHVICSFKIVYRISWPNGWMIPWPADQSRMSGSDGITGHSSTAHIGTVGLIYQNRSRPPWIVHENFAP